MRLLHAGGDTTMIALWPRQEQVVTTNVHLHTDMTVEEAAISKRPLVSLSGA
jgi:hypothetical protein